MIIVWQDHSGKHESESKTYKGKDIQNIDSSGNMPEKQVYSKLQVIQNFATRLITRTKKFESIYPVPQRSTGYQWAWIKANV